MPNKGTGRTITCQRCNKIFAAPLSSNRRYCSWNCYVPPSDRKCRRCGWPFRAPPSDPQRFCSIECRFPSPAQRLADQLQRKPAPNYAASLGPCLVWTGLVDAAGYGFLNVNGRRVKTHRLAFTLRAGPIPPDKKVCHHCDVPACCAPRHLFLGTTLENNRDAHAKGRAKHEPGTGRFMQVRQPDRG